MTTEQKILNKYLTNMVFYPKDSASSTEKTVRELNDVVPTGDSGMMNTTCSTGGVPNHSNALGYHLKLNSKIPGAFVCGKYNTGADSSEIFAIGGGTSNGRADKVVATLNEVQMDSNLLCKTKDIEDRNTVYRIRLSGNKKGQILGNDSAINWGDGTINSANEHTYTVSSTSSFEIRIIESSTNIQPFAENAVTVSDIADNLIEAKISSKVTTIKAYGFYSCENLPSISIPHNVKTIENHAFYNCTGLKNVLFENGVQGVGNYAFSGCTQLTRVDMGAAVAYIGNYAFFQCGSLNTIIIRRKDPPTLANSNAFYRIANDYTIYVPAESVAAYQGATNWSSFADQIDAIPQGV